MKRVLYIVAIFAFMTACQKEESSLSKTTIDFRFSYPSTRATATSFEANDAVSLYAVEWDGETQVPLQVGGNFINNEKLTFDGSAWHPSQVLYWGEQPCDFYALYPYQSSISSIENYPFSLALDQNGGGYEQSDLLYARAEHVSRTDGPVNLQFKHMMSKLVVDLVKGDKFEGQIPDDVVAHVYNTIASCSVNLNTGSVEKDIFGEKPTLTMNKISNERFEAVIVPQNIEKRTPLIELSMGGIAYLLETSLSFRPGYVHTITVTLNTSPDQEQIEISIDPSQEGWN